MVKKNLKLVTFLFVIVVGMFGFGFALVPLYNSLCKTLGINGKVYLEEEGAADGLTVQKNRWVTVEFISTNNAAIPWDFYPKVQKIRVHPGEIAKLSFYAENRTDHRMTVQAIPSVTPGLAAKYLKKTECFCFAEQTLNGHEAMDMPLLFHVDRALPEKINTITLAYTLYDVSARVLN